MFNRSPNVKQVPLSGDETCFAIDDALLDPQGLIQLARTHRDRFQSSGHNAFPGPELRMPDEFSTMLDQFFALHVRRLLGARRTIRAYSRLSLVTLRPEQLSPAQSICHRDRMELEPGRCVTACVLYLFENPSLGGTGFYRPLRSAKETALLAHDASQLDQAAFHRKHGIRAGYMTQSSDWFEKVASVPARFNRLIFYSGMHFHSGDITAPGLLTDDPTTGRLTLNGFFTCRKAAE